MPRNPNIPDEDLLSVNKAAIRFRLDRRWITRRLDAGILTEFEMPEAHLQSRYVSPSEIEALLAAPATVVRR